MRSDPTSRVRRRCGASIGIGAGSMALGLAYLVGLAVGVSRPGRISVVDRINGYGPVWTVAFGAVGLLLVVAAVARRSALSALHAVACAVWGGYAVALGLGSYLSEPKGSFALCIAAATLSWLNWNLGNAYIEDGAG